MADRPVDELSSGGRTGADEVRIANAATYWPVAPSDVVLAVPLAARLLLGATPVGRAVQAVAYGAYAASALQDWAARRGVRKIDFLREFGADVRHLTPVPPEVREQEAGLLIERLNDEFTAERIPRRELAVEVDRHLTSYIAGVTGQRVETSTEVRSFSLVGLLFPFALGACDFVSGGRRCLSGRWRLRAPCHRPRVLPPEGLLEGAGGASVGVSLAHRLGEPRADAVGALRAPAPHLASVARR